MLELILNWKYSAIFVGTFFEGPVVGLLAGLFARVGYLNLFAAYTVHVIADLVADFTYYSIGYFGGEKFLPKAAKFLKFSIEEVEEAKSKFHRNGKKIILFGKLTHVIGMPILIAAGLARYPAISFGVFDLIATIIKSAGIIAIGYYFGGFWQKIDSFLLDVTLIAWVVVAIPTIYFVIKRVKTKK